MGIDPTRSVSQNTSLSFAEELPESRNAAPVAGAPAQTVVAGRGMPAAFARLGGKLALQPSCHGVVQVMVIRVRLSARDPRNLHRLIYILCTLLPTYPNSKCPHPGIGGRAGSRLSVSSNTVRVERADLGHGLGFEAQSCSWGRVNSAPWDSSPPPPQPGRQRRSWGCPRCCSELRKINISWACSCVAFSLHYFLYAAV